MITSRFDWNLIKGIKILPSIYFEAIEIIKISVQILNKQNVVYWDEFILEVNQRHCSEVRSSFCFCKRLTLIRYLHGATLQQQVWALTRVYVRFTYLKKLFVQKLFLICHLAVLSLVKKKCLTSNDFALVDGSARLRADCRDHVCNGLVF